MKYCPSCKYEYEDEITNCSDCGAELISQEAYSEIKDAPDLEDERGEFIKINGFDWQRLTVLDSQGQADQIKEIMKQFSIPIETREDMDGVLIYAPKVQYQTALGVIHKVFAMTSKSIGAVDAFEGDFDAYQEAVGYEFEEESTENDGFGAKILLVLVVVAVAAGIYYFLA